jgi:hypothetical protein
MVEQEEKHMQMIHTTVPAEQWVPAEKEGIPI